MYHLNVFALFVILYTTLLYPLLLILFAKYFNREYSKRGLRHHPSPTVSHIVAVFNGTNSIAAKIEDVLACKPSDGFHELIIVTDGCSDNTALIVAADMRVKLIELKNRVGKEAALIEGIKVAEGEVIIFSDLGTRILPGSAAAILSNFSHESVGVVSSVDCIAGNKYSLGTCFIRYEMMLRRYESKLSSCVGVSGSYFAARRSLCRNLSGGGCSDLDIAMIAVRCGYRAIIDDRVKGYYAASESFVDEFERKQRTIVHGISTVFANCDLLAISRHGWFSWQLFSHKLLRWLTAISAVWLVIYFGTVSFNLAPYLTATGLLTLFLFKLSRGNTGLSSIGFLFASITAILGAIFALCTGNRFRTWKPSNK